MYRIGLVLATILPLPVIVAGAALLMGWPMPAQDSSISASVGFSGAWFVIWARAWLPASSPDWWGLVRSHTDARGKEPSPIR